MGQSSKAKIAKMNDDKDCGDTKYDNAKSHLEVSEKINVSDEGKPDDIHDLKKDSDTTDKLLDNPGSPQLPPISKKDDESDEPVIPKLLGLYFLLLIIFINYFLNVYIMLKDL